MTSKPIVERVLEQRGTTGQITATATVRYADGARLNVTFVGLPQGGTVVVGPPESRTVDYAPSLYGNFNANPTRWIRAFYGDASE